jgi:hypothetical protein
MLCEFSEGYCIFTWMSHWCLKDALKLKSFCLHSSPREICASDVHQHHHACFTAWSLYLHMDFVEYGFDELLWLEIIIFLDRRPLFCLTFEERAMFTGWLQLFNIIMYQWAYFFIFPPPFNSEQFAVDGFKCLHYVSGFSWVRLQSSLPPVILVENQHHSPWLVAFSHYRV